MDTTFTTKTEDKLLGIDIGSDTETRLVLTAPGADKTYVRGTVIARNSTTDKLVPYVQGGADGVGDFYAILAEDKAFLTADSDKSCVVYIKGSFNENALVFEGAGAIADIRAQARERGVFLENAVTDNDSV